MGRKIWWVSNCFDEIELIYQKAKEDEMICSVIEELEALALEEAGSHYDLLKTEKGPITAEQYMAMNDMGKEIVIYSLAEFGLKEFNVDLSTLTITVTFSSMIQAVLGCTFFEVLNRLEKLDGVLNALVTSKITLEFKVPFGGSKGLLKLKMLILQLYPWISIKEVSSNEMVQMPMEQVATWGKREVIESKNSITNSPLQQVSSDSNEERKEEGWLRKRFTNIKKLLLDSKREQLSQKVCGYKEYSLGYIISLSEKECAVGVGARKVFHDAFLKKWRLTIQLDEAKYWFLSVFYLEDGGFAGYSLDYEGASDSHYQFYEEKAIRERLYRTGDEERYFDEILSKYVGEVGGSGLYELVKPYITEEYHFD